jgi:hypothetical protein
VVRFNGVYTDFDLVLNLSPYVLYQTPKRLYLNALFERDQILNENKGESGIYIFINRRNATGNDTKEVLKI